MARRSAVPLLLLVMGAVSACPRPVVDPRPVVVFPPPLLPGQHDVAQREEHRLRFERAPSGYRLIADSRLSRDVISARAARWRHWSLADPYYARVSKLEAWRGTERVAAAAILHISPELEDVFISSFRAYIVDFGVPRVGDRLHLRYRRRYGSLALGPSFTLGSVDRVRRFRLEVAHPKDVRVDFARRWPSRPGGGEVVARIDRRPRRTTLELRNVPLAHDLPYLPTSWQRWQIRPRFRAASGRSVGQPRGGLELAQWYRRRLRSQGEVARRSRTLVRRLIRGLSTPEQKVRAIYSFARDQIRYVADERGENAFVPRWPANVVDRRYGDCKDKAFLLRRLATLAGLTVDLVLVNTRDRPAVGGPTAGLFDHMIARWHPRGRAPIYLDATCRECGFGELPDADVGKLALVVTDEKGPPPRLFRLPARPEADPTISVALRLHVGRLDRAKASIVLRGTSRRVAMAARRLTPQAFKRRWVSLLEAEVRDIRFSRLSVRSADSAQLTLAGWADLSQFIVTAGGGRHVPAAPLPVVPWRLDERLADRLPIILAHRPYVELTLHIDGVTDTAPAAEGATNLGDPSLATFSHELRCGAAPQRVELRYRYRRPRARFSGLARKKLVAFFQAYRRLRRKMLVLARPSASKQKEKERKAAGTKRGGRR
jgi:hypothetical protein